MKLKGVFHTARLMGNICQSRRGHEPKWWQNYHTSAAKTMSGSSGGSSGGSTMNPFSHAEAQKRVMSDRTLRMTHAGTDLRNPDNLANCGWMAMSAALEKPEVQQKLNAVREMQLLQMEQRLGPRPEWVKKEDSVSYLSSSNGAGSSLLSKSEAGGARGLQREIDENSRKMLSRSMGPTYSSPAGTSVTGSAPGSSTTASSRAAPRGTPSTISNPLSASSGGFGPRGGASVREAANNANAFLSKSSFELGGGGRGGAKKSSDAGFLSKSSFEPSRGSRNGTSTRI